MKTILPTSEMTNVRAMQSYLQYIFFVTLFTLQLLPGHSFGQNRSFPAATSIYITLADDTPIAGPIALSTGLTLKAHGTYGVWSRNGIALANNYSSTLTITQPGIYTATTSYDTYNHILKKQVTSFISAQDIVVYDGSTVNGMPLSFSKETTVLKRGLLLGADLATLAIAEKNQQVTYWDGLGRAEQKIQIEGSPAKQDLVSFQQYDQFGGTPRSYLPYAKTATAASAPYHTDAANEQNDFYDLGAPRVAADLQPYSTATVEASPLARVQQATQAGTDRAGHPNKISYQTNQSNDLVRRWTGLDGSSFYTSNSLFKHVQTDADGRRTETYLDLNERVILQRRIMAETGRKLDTYTVYDDAGRTLYTIPPGAVERLPASGIILDNTFKNRWLYQYSYDDIGRVITRQMPGAKAIHIVYDKLDRPILVQDGNRRTTNSWYFTKYNAQGRAVIEGLYTDNTSTQRTQLQALADAWTGGSAEDRLPATPYTTYTTNQTFPEITASNGTILSRSFFDDYDLDANDQPDYQYQTQVLGPNVVQPEPSARTRGRLTVTHKRIVLENNSGTPQYGGWLVSVLFYDDYGNLIQKQGNNHLNVATTLSDITTMVYREQGFVPQLLFTHKKQVAPTGTVVIRNRFGYDHAGRLVDAWQQNELNSQKQPEILLAHHVYNELGQEVEKNLHSRDNGVSFLQSEDFSYNINGQLTAINNSALTSGSASYDDANDVFGMELLREQTEEGLYNTARYDGGISAVKWHSRNTAQQNQPERERAYTFDYDGLGRLRNADYQAKEAGFWGVETGAYDERNITYDANGNILTLKRYSQDNGTTTPRLIDDLTYNYNLLSTNGGNQLRSVTDTGDPNSGFRDAGTLNNEYQIDDNGNIRRDDNKGVDYTYNVLNKVDRQQNSPTQSITYHYSAEGVVLRRTVSGLLENRATITRTFDYVDGFAYESVGSSAPLLASVPTTEGRVLLLPDDPTKFVYEYHLRDHLGNLRVAFRAQSKTEDLHLAFEGQPTPTEEGAYPKFQGVAASRVAGTSYHAGSTTPGTYAGAVSATQAGPHTRIPVAHGDHLKLRVYYQTPNGPQYPLAPAEPMTMVRKAPLLAVAPLIGPPRIAEAEHSRPQPTLGVQLNVLGLLGSLRKQAVVAESMAPAGPILPPQQRYAYLAWTLYDDKDQPVSSGRQNASAYFDNAWRPLEKVLDIQLPDAGTKNGYLKVQLLNDGTQSVFFDSLTIRHPKDELLISQENHYYPFGLNLSGVAVNTQPGEKISKNQFNGGSQLQDELLGEQATYSTFFRTYDPLLGRFQGIDSKASSFADVSPYQFALNDPINLNDPNGDEATVYINGRPANPRNVYGQRVVDDYTGASWMNYQEGVTVMGGPSLPIAEIMAQMRQIGLVGKYNANGSYSFPIYTWHVLDSKRSESTGKTYMAGYSFRSGTLTLKGTPYSLNFYGEFSGKISLGPQIGADLSKELSAEIIGGAWNMASFSYNSREDNRPKVDGVLINKLLGQPDKSKVDFGVGAAFLGLGYSFGLEGVENGQGIIKPDSYTNTLNLPTGIPFINYYFEGKTSLQDNSTIYNVGIEVSGSARAILGAEIKARVGVSTARDTRPH
ncbi:DUF6443 domain-containing protein [Hymenobacter lucidus]|uniref:DUF6443 domain-containing protein n=1 Tax=Hymenobacter lucidus TaxID=2880930 RepID=A0ABS8AQP9_9BACT|nr:DUF6443 domain-containing protein [Hymenobacter lucidus]MCB2407641.1 DUF6443 domain-containing protein [Hymenobacter lucidus]